MDGFTEGGGIIPPPPIQKWDLRFLNLAQHVSTWSKDPSTQVGAVITDTFNRVLSVGYNGLARNVDDSDERLNDRNLKYKLIIHAEKNAILFSQTSLQNAVLYTYPFMPCATCASFVIQSGIKRIVAPISNNERWLVDFELSTKLFDEAHIQLDLINPLILG